MAVVIQMRHTTANGAFVCKWFVIFVAVKPIWETLFGMDEGRIFTTVESYQPLCIFSPPALKFFDYMIPCALYRCEFFRGVWFISAQPTISPIIAFDAFVFGHVCFSCNRYAFPITTNGIPKRIPIGFAPVEPGANANPTDSTSIRLPTSATNLAVAIVMIPYRAGKVSNTSSKFYIYREDDD